MAAASMAFAHNLAVNNDAVRTLRRPQRAAHDRVQTSF